MSHFNNTFPDEERREWVEKCSSCGEEFISRLGGAQCKINNCSQKQLEEEHGQVLPKMVEYSLPQHSIRVRISRRHSKGGIEAVGWAMIPAPYSLTIPWYTLRMKCSFFSTTAHELAHIGVEPISKRKKFTSYYAGKRRYRNWRDFNEKELAEIEKEHPDHLRAWQVEYERIHWKLMNSPYRRYNYNGLPPVDYPESISWNWN